jgi:hypothetical protein
MLWISLLQNAEGNNSPCTFNNEDKDHCSTRKEIFCLDWWFHLSILIYLPANVDFQTGIWWVWSFNCPQKMFLDLQNKKINIDIFNKKMFMWQLIKKKYIRMHFEVQVTITYYETFFVLNQFCTLSILYLYVIWILP